MVGYEVLVVFVVPLFSGCWCRLDSLDLGGFSSPSSTLRPQLTGGIIGDPFNEFPQEGTSEPGRKYTTQGNLRKKFSYVRVKKLKGTEDKEHFEALRSNPNVRQEGIEEVNDAPYKSPKARVFGSRYSTERNTSTRSIAGPNSEGQQPYRHWSTESNVIREEHPEGRYQQYPYVEPSREEAYPRGNLKKYFEQSSTTGYNLTGRTYSSRALDEEVDGRHLIIPPTTYRPLLSKDLLAYSSTSTNNRSPKEERSGNFRGNVRYKNPFAVTEEVDYERRPDGGITTSERSPIAILPRRRPEYVTSSTGRPIITTRGGLLYQSPSTSDYYSSTTPTPVVNPSIPYQPPLFVPSTVETPYVPPETYMYYPEPKQYVMYVPNYGSYAFSYDAGDHERTESRNRDGNVRGAYRFDGTDGQMKEVTYEADARRGFVAQGGHLPPQPEPATAQVTTHTEEQPSASAGTYFFRYNAGEHMREERKDEDGNVHGVYSYISSDGTRKTVKYRANPSEGFVAEGDDIPRQSDGSYVYSYKMASPQYPTAYQPQIAKR